METKSVNFLLIIGICCGFLTCSNAQVDVQRKLWCEGVDANTYIRNETDCRVWIRCNGPNSSPSSGFCPNPSYFSVELQKCTSEKAANCFVCPDTTSTSLHSVANSCSRFIRCNGGVGSELSCGIGMGFNPETDKCEPGFYRTCRAQTTAPITELSTHSPTTDTPTSDTWTSDEPTSDTPTSDEPTSDTPTSDTPTSDTPTSDTPTSDTWTSDTPTSDTPTTIIPPTDDPSEEIPSADTPSSTSTPFTPTPFNPTPFNPTP
ncbi:hypothetical protein HA402_015268 [Bradysia odoriphaga]|nr:hypothetical protein HA402_015268 [Bradysia odoriphaga]